MITPKYLQNLGEALSKDYIEANVPLTEGLEKIARELTLNEHQIQRVAEAANVDTYLHFLKTASADKRYIKFPLADAKEVTHSLKKEASYTQTNLAATEHEYMFDLTETFDLEKVAATSEELLTLDGDLKMSTNELKKLAEYDMYMSDLDLANSTFLATLESVEQSFNKLAALKKQYILSGEFSEQDVDLFLKTAAVTIDENYIEILEAAFNKDLPKESLHTSEIDKTTQLYKLAEELYTNIKLATGYAKHAENIAIQAKSCSIKPSLVKTAATLSHVDSEDHTFKQFLMTKIAEVVTDTAADAAKKGFFRRH